MGLEMYCWYIEMKREKGNRHISLLKISKKTPSDDFFCFFVYIIILSMYHWYIFLKCSYKVFKKDDFIFQLPNQRKTKYLWSHMWMTLLKFVLFGLLHFSVHNCNAFSRNFSPPFWNKLLVAEKKLTFFTIFLYYLLF